ncbi:hypothetical protein ACI0YZ_000208, partial [Cronobacter sakazakii]|uniref:hypothetical protein n=1 Tax=Cronobacter sakazakii TaxID=28141 RepID=UPI001ED96E7C
AGIKPSPYRLFCGGLKKRWVRFAYPPYEPRDADAAITSIPLPLLHAKKKPPRVGRLSSLPVIRS